MISFISSSLPSFDTREEAPEAVVEEKMWLAAIPTGGDSPLGEIERETGGLDVEANREDNDVLEVLLDKPDSKAGGA